MATTDTPDFFMGTDDVDALVAKSNTNAKPQSFRARPWPVVLGGHVDLRAKARRHPTRGLGLSSFAEMVDHLESIPNGVHGLDIDPSWRKRMWMHCDGSGKSDDFMSEDADEEFLELRNSMCLNDEWNLIHRPCAAERELLEWLMEHDLSILEILLDDGLVSIGDLFDPCTLEWQSFSGGEAESLLAMAAKHVCSPAAVRMLLARGADPNSKLVHLLSFNDYLPTCGPGALAWNDVNRHWCGDGDPVKKVEILTALGEAGGDMFDAWDAYDGRKRYEVEFAACGALFKTECARKRAKTKRRLETVVALVGIVSFWRRAAAAPDSRAARSAIARVVKRARE